MVLKYISPIIPPELLKCLAEMGHGDELVIGDGNFPSESVAKACGAKIVRMDGSNGVEVLKAIMALFPLDTYVKEPAAVMARTPEDEARGVKCPIWGEYEKILSKAEARNVSIEKVERFAFYERAKKAYLVIATGEKAIYANLILKKGVISSQSNSKKVLLKSSL
eukprot:TRINITY_DN279_c1_g1_i1.p1 TRINITY_DN279_c1_g1~~TRINITY_DN279_c1_g1_i1.p1  ORF type:complete len:165 (+),score=43.38 TRINITY_DN279_c1_g1_i1:54-548(+)